jgi:hypothetical protein
MTLSDREYAQKQCRDITENMELELTIVENLFAGSVNQAALESSLKENEFTELEIIVRRLGDTCDKI